MAQADGLATDAPPTRRARAKVERRQALIEATIAAIAEHGLSGTTLARVTESAGTSIGLAHFHFDNKQRLFEAVLQDLADRERAVWQDHIARSADTPTARLIALIDARFDPRICNPRTLAVWFAFWGDAGARSIYRCIVAQTDDARLDLTIDLIERLAPLPDSPPRDAKATALGLEAFYDGLWLNLLLYPKVFNRADCRQRALEHLAALFPHHVDGPPPSTAQTGQTDRRQDLPDAP